MRLDLRPVSATGQRRRGHVSSQTEPRIRTRQKEQGNLLRTVTCIYIKPAGASTAGPPRKIGWTLAPELPCWERMLGDDRP